MKILICGDTSVSDELIEKIATKQHESASFNNLCSLFTRSNYDVISANIEGPITDSKKNIIKNGPCLKSSLHSANFLSKMGVNLATLANNHIYDFGREGLLDTINCLKKNDIEYIGACDVDGCFKNYCVYESNGIKVGFYSLCENEFSTNVKNNDGANGIDITRNLIEIKHIKQKVDFLIVFFHGGKELFRFPTYSERKYCRLFVDFGADYVVAQHSHCVGCKELYHSKTIVYGQGNFIFRSSSLAEYKTSVLISLSIEKGKIHDEFIPIETCGIFVKISENKSILNGFFNRSLELQNGNRFSKAYEYECKKSEPWFLYSIFNKSKIYIKLDYHLFKSFFIKKYARKHINHLVRILNLLQCESHNEIVTHIIKKELEKH